MAKSKGKVKVAEAVPQPQPAAVNVLDKAAMQAGPG